MTMLSERPALFGLSDATAALAARVQRGVVAVRSRAGGGSGTIWRQDGLIITNNHVVPDDRAEVVTWDDQVFPARVTARDPLRDLATLQAEARDLPAIAAANSDALRAGQLVFAVGNPWGQRGVVTAGVVLGVGRFAPEHGVPLEETVRADVRLAPGNSGGPLVDASGSVVGVNAMIAGGVAVAVPSNTVGRYLEDGPLGGGYLGITGEPVRLDHRVAAEASDGTGLLLTSVAEDSPAARAGLLPGDVLLGVDGAVGVQASARRLARMRPNQPVRLALLRGERSGVVEALPVRRS